MTGCSCTVARTFFNSGLVLLPLVFSLWCRSKKLSNTQQELPSKGSRNKKLCKTPEHVGKVGGGLGQNDQGYKKVKAQASKQTITHVSLNLYIATDSINVFKTFHTYIKLSRFLLDGLDSIEQHAQFPFNISTSQPANTRFGASESNIISQKQPFPSRYLSSGGRFLGETTVAWLLRFKTNLKISNATFKQARWEVTRRAELTPEVVFPPLSR